MDNLAIVDLALLTLKHAASADGFRKNAGAREFFSCSDIDALLMANGEASQIPERNHASMSMPANDVAELCESVIKKLCQF